MLTESGANISPTIKFPSAEQKTGSNQLIQSSNKSQLQFKKLKKQSIIDSPVVQRSNL
jgi:hypothetical protein